MQIDGHHISDHFKQELANIEFAQKEDIISFLEFWYSKENGLTIMTSGSTGVPKPIELTRDDLTASAQLTIDYFDLKEGDTVSLCLPTKYIAGKLMLVRALTGNLNLISTTPSLRPLKDLGSPIDFAAMTPAQVEESLKYDSNKFQLIRQLIIGGAPVSKQLEAALKSIPTICYSTYGMTETVTHIALKQLNKSDSFAAIGNVTFSTDSEGRLIINTPHLSTTIHQTNDVIKLIDATHFEYLGRIDHVINSGGVKIHPEIVEKKLETLIHQRYFITKQPHETLGEQVVLVIEGSHSISIETLTPILEKFEVPKQIITINQFKETPTGKVIRKI